MKSLDQHTTSDPKHWEQSQTLKTRELLEGKKKSHKTSQTRWNQSANDSETL